MKHSRYGLALLALALLLLVAALAEGDAPAYEVTLPASYEESEQRYPVLFVLPEDGFTPDASGLSEQLTAAMAEGAGAEMILVRPALEQGCDPAATLRAVAADVDAHYRTVADPAYRAAAGTGVGGYLAYAVALGEAENSPVRAAASIRGDFVSGANPWVSVCGEIREKLEALHRKDVEALNAIYTYMDAPVEDDWTDMPGSTDDLGALFISYKTGSAFHEFTVRAGAYGEAFLAESARRALNRLTASMLAGAISGKLTLEQTVLTPEDKDFAANFDIALSEKVRAFTEGEAPVGIRIAVEENGAEEQIEDFEISATELASGRVQLMNTGKAASATVRLTAKLFGAQFPLGSADIIRVQPPVLDGETQILDLMGDWHFTYVGAKNALDAAALTRETFEAWPVVQPGLGNWAKGFGDISEKNVRSPSPDYFGFYIVGNGYYARTFTVPEGFDAAAYELAVGYVDDRCEVFVNGTRVGATGMDDRGQPTKETTWAVFSHFPVASDLLHIGGENTVVVRAWNDLPYGAGGWYGGPVGLYSRAAFDARFGEAANARFYEESYPSRRAAAALTKSEPWEEKYLIYLPEDYATSGRYYPTVYLLHQFNSDHTAYRTDRVNELLDDGIARGLFDGMIVVIPNSDENSWWTGHWEKMITEELIPLIDSRYRTIDDPRFRLTAGCSMGGQGAYGVALRNPNFFGGAVSFFGAFSYGGASSPNAIAAAESADYLRHFALYFVCGNQDNYGFGEPAIRLHQQLKALGVPHGFYIENGAHDGGFYLPRFQEGLAYARAHMLRGDGSLDTLFTGEVTVEGAKVTARVSAGEGLAAWLPALPASSYTLEETPALRVPVILEVSRNGETLCTLASRDAVFTADSPTAEVTFELPAAAADAPATLNLKAAPLDRLAELARVEIGK